MYERYAREYQDYIVDQLAARGFDPATSSQRFAQSVDIVLGKKRIYLQEPRYYYFPGLPQIQFYEREQFPWLDALERETDAISAELQARDAAARRVRAVRAGRCATGRRTSRPAC